MIACHTSVFVACAKMTQVTSRSNKKHFSTWKGGCKSPLQAPAPHNTCGSWWSGTPRQFSYGMCWEGGSALIADRRVKWLYLACYWAYLHQTWGFCKAWSALYDYVHQQLLIPFTDLYLVLHGLKTGNGCHCSGDMAVCMHKVLARLWVGVPVSHLLLLLFSHKFTDTPISSKCWSTFSGMPWENYRAVPSIQLQRVVWRWRLKGCFAPTSAVKGRLHRVFSPISARWLCHADEA